MPERPFGQRLDERAQPFRAAAHDGVRKRNRALEPGGPDELDRLVHRRARRHAVEKGELVCADAQRRPNRWIELADGATAERLDSVVERPRALDGTEGDLLRECAVARVQTLRGSPEGAVGVRVLLEDAQDDLVRGAPGRRDAHCKPRRNAS